ncbi:MAG TPA: hypothetical protein VFT22_30580 [Kofleriaceae bacterium]|nr:hypothetical protein [Kofleriaceae bacterium]
MHNRFAAWVVWSFLVGASCAEAADSGDDAGAISQPAARSRFPPPGATTADTPIGIALDVEDGVAVPLRIRSR